jgi:hypothetical protein
MEELQKQLIAIQLIQELIVDVLDSNNVISRIDFEDRLNDRVHKLNKDIEKYNNESTSKSKNKIPIISTIIGEA